MRENSLKNFLILIISLFSIANAGEINLDSLATDAKKSNKTVLIFLHQPNCGYCSRMINESIKNISIKKRLQKKFVLVDINIADEGIVKYKNFKGSKLEFARILDADFYPSSIFLDEKGKIAYPLIGYRDRAKFLLALQYIESKSYKEMSLETFKDTLEFNKD